MQFKASQKLLRPNQQKPTKEIESKNVDGLEVFFAHSGAKQIVS